MESEAIHRMAEIRGITYEYMRYRLSKMTFAEAVYGATSAGQRTAKRYRYRGTLHTVKQLAATAGISEIAMHGRLRRNNYDAEKSMQKRRPSQEKVYQYDGKPYTARQLAQTYNVALSTMRANLSMYGVVRAVELALASKQKPKRASRKGEMPKKPITPEIEPADEDAELKRRIEAYRARGWSDDEILIKLRAA